MTRLPSFHPSNKKPNHQLFSNGHGLALNNFTLVMVMAFTEVVNNNNNASNVAMEFRIASKWGYWESWSIEGYMKPNCVETSNVNIKCKS